MLLQTQQKIKLTIRNLGHHGEGIGSYEGYTIFVPGALPGETIEAQLLEKHKSYGRARLLSIIQPSAARIDPPCPYFGKCGGCQLMHLAYSEQLLIKQQRVKDALERIGKLQNIQVAPCIPSPSTFAYRNKIQLPLKEDQNGVKMGLYAPSSHDLIEVDHCLIHGTLGEEIYQKIQGIIKQSNGAARELRHLLIRSAMNTQEVLVILVTAKESCLPLSSLAKKIISCHPSIKGVVQNINQSGGNTILGKTYKVLEGVGYITECLGGLYFKISPASFFQVNPEQAEALYANAIELAELNGSETVLDAYCGVGTLSLFFSKHVKKVLGVECVPEAIADAKENGKINRIDNVNFVCSNTEAFISTLSDVDVILLNPPRKGCDPSVLNGIQKILPKKVIYISCDPATLARDLSQLQTYGYKIQTVQPFDMFPQTAHVECIVKMGLAISQG